MERNTNAGTDIPRAMTNLPELEPRDRHNLALEAHVHPGDYTNPEPFDGKYNLVVIGAGTAGLVTAAGAAGLGAKVALVERRLMGGDCLNVGCVPSKGIIATARRAAEVRGAGDFGVRVPDGVAVDFGAAMERMRKLRSGLAAHDSVQRFTALGIDVFLGDGRFVDRETVEVAGAKLRFKKAVIATGARAAAPPIPGLDTVEYLTNETLFSLTELPERFGIVGGGPIGCEMAQAFARLGSNVLHFTDTKGILPREDRDAAALVRAAMERDGVRIVEGGKELAVSKNPDGSIRLRAGNIEEAVDRLLIAVGRAPNVEGLGLEAAGVDFDRKGVKVDDRLRTANPNIFAAGDICSPYQFTHAADFMARTVLRNALFLGRAKASALVIPWSTYTAPEIARVGLDENEAKKKGIAIDTYTQPMSGVDRAILDGETEGFVRIHTEKGKARIVGATIVAAHAGDLIGAVSLAMTNGLGLGGIANAIHPYPTQAEALRKVGDLYSRTRLTPFVAKLMKKWLAWSRR